MAATRRGSNRHLGRQPERSIEKDNLEHFERFCYSLKLPDDGGRFRLQDFQLAQLKDYFDGIFESLWLEPTGQGKSTLLGALALHHGTYVRVNPRVYILGGLGVHGRNTLDAASAFIAGSADLSRWWVAQEYEMGRIKSLIAEDSKGLIENRSAGRRVGERGGSPVEGTGPTLILVEETHRHEDGGAAVRTLISKAQKRSQGRQKVRAVHATTPGESMQSVLGRMVERATDVDADATVTTTLRRVKSALDEAPARTARDVYYRRAVDADGDLVMHEFAVPDKIQPPKKGASREKVREYLKHVKRANPASFVTVDGLRLSLKASSAEPWVFLRQHAGQWVTQDFAAIDKVGWYGCERRGIAIPPGDHHVYVGLDMGEKWATTAIVPVWVDPETGRPRAAHAQFLTSDVAGTRRRQRKVLDVLNAMRETWPNLRLVFDRAKGGGLIAEQLEEDHGLVVIDHPQNTPFELASMMFGELVDQQEFEHDGHPELTAHVLAAVAKRSYYGRRWRIEQPRDGQPIDGADAVVMATNIAMNPPNEERVIDPADYRITRL